jgi:UDP-N-acetylmuramoyl-L-alanyl-D-glutamate--2,6-diaminopimelate ligase
MKLKKVLKDIAIEDVKGSKEVEITGVCSNSKLVSPGNLFIAKKGNTVDGAVYIPEAISAGATAILTDFYDPTLKNVTQIIHHNVKSIEPQIAAQFHQFPSDQLFMVGITGTNGKTTTAYLTKHLLDSFRGPCGLVGTIEYIIGEHAYQATHTTPDVSTNQKLLREMLNMGCHSAVMEVTSHALEQGRVENIHYDIGIFTNLTQEHLDYHFTMDGYCLAKNKLFRKLNSEKRKKLFPLTAIVNRDDPYHERILEGCKAQVITYGLNPKADLFATEIKLSSEGTKFQMHYQGKSYPVSLPLIGRYNVYNCLAVIACGISQNFPIEQIVERLRTAPLVPARLELVPNDLGLKIYVDFAHKPDALENVIKCLQEFNQGRVITVFGCGGNRDRTKRPLMASVCEKYSNVCIVTTDNPRNEEPEAIVEEIVKGFSSSHSYIIELDRRKAIGKAIEMATPKDIILIAGKGHETQQIFAHHTIEFDDRVVAKESCNKLALKV